MGSHYYSIRTWHSKLKNFEPNDQDDSNSTSELNFDSDLDISNSSFDVRLIEPDILLSNEHDVTLNQNESTDSENKIQEKVLSEEANESRSDIQDLNMIVKAITKLFTSLSSLIVMNCLILVFLINHIITDDRLAGLFFVLTSLVVLTCTIFYYPSYKLIQPGYLHLRIIKWIYGISCFALFFNLFKKDIQYCSSLALSVSIGFKLFREVPFMFPKTFTFDELLINCSIFSCAFFTFVCHIHKHALVWLLITTFLCKRFSIFNNSILGFSLACLATLAFYFVPIIFLKLHQNPFIWLFDFVFKNGFERVFLFVYWMIIFNFMCFLVLFKRISKYHTQQSDAANKKNDTGDEQMNADCNTANKIKGDKIGLTIIRKIFHLFICLVYVLGFIYDRNFLFLCSYGMFILLVLIEIMRYLKVGFVSHIIQEYMGLFLDEKDIKSNLILSHIYLLVGFSFGLWISNLNKFTIAELSGLITVGIGDSFASIVGSRYGKHKFPGSSKSIEGSLGLVSSQLIVYLILHFLHLINLYDFYNLFFIIFNLLLTAFVEAFTNDNDNLVLPIVAYPFLCLIK